MKTLMMTAVVPFTFCSALWAATEYLVKPHADVGPNEYTPTPSGSHYVVVDEDPANGDTDYLRTFYLKSEVYSLDASAIPDGTLIENVRLQMTINNPNTATSMDSHVALRIGTTDFPGTTHTVDAGSGYGPYSDSWSCNPSIVGCPPWTKADIAAMKIKHVVTAQEGLPRPRLTQFVVFVLKRKNFYIDRSCPTAGNGATITCSSSSTTNNPKTDIDAGIALLSDQDDVLNIRGVHSAHDNCPGSASGRHFGNKFQITSKNGASDHNIIVQSYSWSGVGTGEKVYLDGTRCANNAGGSCNVAWTHCVWSGTCSCGAIGNGSQAACEETWSVTDNGTAPTGFPGGNADKVIGAQRDSGSPTFRVASRAAMTNATAGYNPNRCHTSTYIACNFGNDCPSGEACDVTETEIDSYSAQTTGTTLYVRWGTSLPSTPYIFYSQNGYGFQLETSTFITIRGFTFRAHLGAAILIVPASDNGVHDIVAQDNHIFYAMDLFASGSDYGMVSSQAPNTTFADNEVAYTASEAFHIEARNSANATPIFIQRNWIHNTGDQNVLGPNTRGTPQGSTLGEKLGGGGAGDYTGSIFEGNLTQNLPSASGQSAGIGMILENNSHGWIIRNNIFDTISSQCIKLDAKGSASGANTSNNEIYNNLCRNYGTNPGGAGSPGTAGIYLLANTATNAASANKIYNNSFVTGAGPAVYAESPGGTTTMQNNLVRNNIAYFTAATKAINWINTDTSNLFENNFVVTTADPAITWLNVNRACSAISSAGAGNIDNCPSPVFVSASDFHIQTTSPAKDAGTATGMPAGRTTDVCNSIANAHGLASYNDCQAIQNGTWDIGVDEK